MKNNKKQRKPTKGIQQPNFTLSIKKKTSTKNEVVKSPQSFPSRRLSIKDVKSKQVKDHKQKKIMKPKDNKQTKITEYLKQKYLSPKKNIDDETQNQYTQPIKKQTFTIQKQQSNSNLKNQHQVNVTKKKISFRHNHNRMPTEQVNKEYDIKNRQTPLFKSKQRIKKGINDDIQINKQSKSDQNIKIFMNEGAPIKNNKSIKNNKNSPIRMISSGKQYTSDNNCESQRHQTPSKTVRFSKFAFRSQKYIRLSSELKLQEEQKKQQNVMDETETDPYESPNISPIRDNDGSQSNYYKLQKQIKFFKQMINRSENVLKLMNGVYTQEKQKLLQKKKHYREQINLLKEKINQNKMKNNLGHIFSYDDFDMNKLIPSDIIVQKIDKNDEQSNIELDYSTLKQRGQMIINYYENLGKQITSQEEQNDDDALSINSK